MRKIRQERIAWIADGDNPPTSIAERTQAFWGQMSRGCWEVEARAFALTPERQTTCKPSRTNWCNIERAAQVRDEGYSPTRSYIIGGYAQGAGGVATMPGRSGAIFSNASKHAPEHESGHSFGLGHSNRIDASGKVDEYADRSTIMGSRSPDTGLNAVQAHFLEFVDPRSVIASQRVRLVPWEMREDARHADEACLVCIRHAGNFHGLYGSFWLCIRPTKGQPYIPQNNRIGLPPEPLVQIIFANPNARSMPTYLVSELPVGASSEVTEGLTVEHILHSEGGSVVDITIDGKPITETPEAPSGLPDRNSLEAVDGIWWDRWMGGQGFDVHVRDGKAVLYWYTFTDKGGLDWYYGTFKEGGEVFDLRRVVDGVDEVVGEARFRVTDYKVGAFDYVTTMHGRNSWPLELLAQTSHPHDGLYWNPQRDKEGFALRFQVSRCFGYFYTFERGQPVWYHLDGHAGPEAYDLVVCKARGVFNRYNVGDYMTRVGKAGLKPLPTGEWRFVWGDVSTDIRRLF